MVGVPTSAQPEGYRAHQQVRVGSRAVRSERPSEVRAPRESVEPTEGQRWKT